MAYKEIKGIVRNVKRRLKSDKNRPYKTRIKSGPVNRFGKQEYELGEIDLMLTQPLGFKDFVRLSEGDKQKTWRFATVIPPEVFKLGLQIQYKGIWFEVKKINDWDSIMSAHIVSTK